MLTLSQGIAQEPALPGAQATRSLQRSRTDRAGRYMGAQLLYEPLLPFIILKQYLYLMQRGWPFYLIKQAQTVNTEWARR